MASFPRPEAVSVEIRCDSSYYLEGRGRTDETHCLYEYTLGGRGCFRDAAGEHSVGPGEGFLCEICDPDTAYYYPVDAVEPWVFVYITFRGELATAMVREMVQRYGPVFPLDPDGDMIHRLLGYSAMDGRDIPISAAQGARFVTDLLTELSARREPPPQQDPAGLLVRRAVDLIRRNIGVNFNVSELADMLDVSREHLARTFRAQTSQSPYQYIVRRKMLHACRLLKESDVSIKQVAAAVGAGDTAHFNRTFKATLKMTPSQFRISGMMPSEL